jgi:hypothetical protein
MANNTFDRVVIDPTLEQVANLLVEAAETANRGQRARTVSASGLVREVTEKWETNQSFADWVDGGGVPNAYRGFASTTVIGVAFVDVAGRRHVRVYASRCEAPKSSYGTGKTGSFGLSASRYARASVESLVYPALQMALATRKKDRGVVAEMMRACESDPLDLLAWSALADYLAENGDSDFLRTGLVATAKDALAAVQNVRAMLEPATPSVA